MGELLDYLCVILNSVFRSLTCYNGMPGRTHNKTIQYAEYFLIYCNIRFWYTKLSQL